MLQLDQFTGTEKYHKVSPLYPFVLTDGVRYLADEGKAWWLLDAIASYRKREPFQVWSLDVAPDKTALLLMREDKDAPILVKQHIEYTDFPLDRVEVWVIDGVALLPSEY